MHLSITNILCILIGIISGLSFSKYDVLNRFSLQPYRVKYNKEYFRLITHATLHKDMAHLFFNLFALFSFGNAVESQMKSELYVILFVGAVLFATIPAMYKQHNNAYYQSIGASGGVSAVMMFFMVLFPDVELLFFFILPLPGWAAVILFFGLEYYMNKKSGTGIAHDAHISGAIFGLLFLLILHPTAYIRFFQAVSNSIF
ncbi:MAG: rhomboid family intramembrane serine protease [Bacteroidota bacterium]|jgi:membrane associated rhomboid family serine protease